MRARVLLFRFNVTLTNEFGCLSRNSAKYSFQITLRANKHYMYYTYDDDDEEVVVVVVEEKMPVSVCSCYGCYFDFTLHGVACHGISFK